MRKWLRDIREEKGITQEEAADRLGMSTAYYSLIERGERQKMMTIGTLQKIAKVFEWTLSGVVFRELKWEEENIA